MAYPRALARAQQIITRATLNTTGTIYRRATVADTTGGTTETYSVVLSIPCSFSRYQITPVEREGAITVQAISVWTFVFPYGTDVQVTDRIVCNGRTFEVTSSGSGSLEVAKRVLCTEIT